MSQVETSAEKTPILISGLPGKVATLVAEAVHGSNDLSLYYHGLASRRNGHRDVDILNTRVDLIGEELHLQVLQLFKNRTDYRNTPGIAVDYTSPESANRNARLFAEAEVPFVMGTSGGDRAELAKTVRDSQICAVIAPNMSAPMVVVQAMLEHASQTFPNSLEGWRLSLTESHQAAKKDVSGTAKAWLPLLQNLGFTLEDDISSIRDSHQQQALGVSNLDGHAYHWVKAHSPDTTNSLELVTRINGRSTYADGTLKAIRFLRDRVRDGVKGQVYSMIDVLKAGTS